MKDQLPLAIALGILLPAVLWSPSPAVLGAALALGAVTAFLVGRWLAGQPARDLERLYWHTLLRPLAGLGPAEVERRLEALASEPLCPPLGGPTRFAVRVLRRKLASVAGTPLERVVRRDLLAYRPLLVRRPEG